ncbi:MAG: sortase [Clostridia bacterium]|nr:sortase [Clostridia bacterium]
MNQILVTEKIYVTPELKKKKKIYKIEFFLSIILICLFSSYYIHAAYDRDKSEEVSQIILTEIKDNNIKEYCDNDPIIIILDDNLSNNKQKEEKLEKEIYIDNVIYPIESIIKIPKIGINYPVISKTSEELLKISVNKFHGPNPNEVGNYCIVGHNYLNDKMFSRLDELKNGDIVELKDLSGKIIEYRVYDKYIVNPTDTSCTSQRTKDGKKLGFREITLITCANYGTQRLIVKCREIK